MAEPPAATRSALASQSCWPCWPYWPSEPAEDELVDDDGVFAVLNLDHDRFLSDLDREEEGNVEGGGVPNSSPATADGFMPAGHAHQVSQECGRGPPGPPGPPGGGGDHGAVLGKVQRLSQRLADDVALGKGCHLLRANINALRRRPPDAEPGVSPCDAESRAARVLQAAWRAFVLRHVYLHVRELVRQFSAASAKAALRAVSPREALLADTASDIVVRFRLSGVEGSLLPVVVYKVFTRLPVVDVCRGCCGRLLLCGAAASSGRAATAPCLRGPGVEGWPSRPRSVCCLLFASYKRVENNPWRPCPAGLFDPARCPARGAARAARARGRTAGRTALPRAPAALVGSPTAPPAPRRPSVQEKERLVKIGALRRLYGYESRDETACPPPPPSVSARTQPVHAADLDVGQAVEEHPDDAPQDGVDAPQEAGIRPSPSTPWFPSDAYYQHLLTAWGCGP